MISPEADVCSMEQISIKHLDLIRYIIFINSWERLRLQGIKFYTVDLTKVVGRGEFKCPRCEIEISPDDKTEKVYTILELVMKGDRLEKILLQCNRCKSQIYLTGFHALHKIR